MIPQKINIYKYVVQYNMFDYLTCKSDNIMIHRVREIGALKNTNYINRFNSPTQKNNFYLAYKNAFSRQSINSKYSRSNLKK